MSDRSGAPNPGERQIPFGYNKGKKLKDVPDEELRSLREWCAEKDDEAGTDKFTDLVNDIDQVIEDRQGLPLDLDDRRRPRRGEYPRYQ